MNALIVIEKYSVHSQVRLVCIGKMVLLKQVLTIKMILFPLQNNKGYYIKKIQKQKLLKVLRVQKER